MYWKSREIESTGLKCLQLQDDTGTVRPPEDTDTSQGNINIIIAWIQDYMR